MKNKIHFFNSIAAEPKKRTTFLLVTTVLAGILLIWYLMFVILAFRTDGGLSAYYGSAGVMAVLLSIATSIVISELK